MFACGTEKKTRPNGLLHLKSIHPCGRFWKSVSQRGSEFSYALDLPCDFYIRFITEGANVLFKSSTGGVWNSNGIAQFEQIHTDSVSSP